MGEFEFDFEKLKVYQKSLDFIDKVFEIYKTLNTEFKYSIGKNLIRAGLSIANNIAEGNDKISSKEKNRYFSISSDSARECVSVLNVIARQKLIENDVSIKMRRDAREITSMLHALMNRK
ncbi:MAG: four helix bundle protein [Candidatus Omnitrophica bacterium]|nr:four helix bundle protein [Candidatus Omnitrophota bacterium]